MFDPHVLVATNMDDPTKGGIMLCPVVGCECYSTWSVPQLGSKKADVLVPSPEEIVRIRHAFQMEGEVREYRVTNPAKIAGIGGSVESKSDAPDYQDGAFY
jgi:hypothetical protein